MRFNNKIKPLKKIKPLHRVNSKPRGVKSKYLDELELILYSTNLCLFGARILRNEINVNNRNQTLNLVMKEVLKLYLILSKDNYYSYSKYTKKDTQDFFKEVGLKPKHLKY